MSGFEEGHVDAKLEIRFFARMYTASEKAGQMKVVKCQGAVRHSDTFNFGTRSHVDAFKYWNPSQPQQPDIFQFPSEELVV